MPRRTTQHFAGIPQPGFAFGVSRLPKVLHTTSYLAKVHDVELPMLDNILQPNRIAVDLANASYRPKNARSASSALPSNQVPPSRSGSTS